LNEKKYYLLVCTRAANSDADAFFMAASDVVQANPADFGVSPATFFYTYD
jgi:hypothetical protein